MVSCIKYLIISCLKSYFVSISFRPKVFISQSITIHIFHWYFNAMKSAPFRESYDLNPLYLNLFQDEGQINLFLLWIIFEIRNCLHMHFVFYSQVSNWKRNRWLCSRNRRNPECSWRLQGWQIQPEHRWTGAHQRRENWWTYHFS